MDDALDVASKCGVSARGLGLCRVLDAGERAGELSAALSERGLRVRSYRGGHIALSPGLDQAEQAAARLKQALTTASYALRARSVLTSENPADADSDTMRGAAAGASLRARVGIVDADCTLAPLQAPTCSRVIE